MAKKLSGQTFVVTGTLEGYSRAEAKSAIETLGGKVSGSVSANTDCVMVGADSGSKADKAKQLGIKTLNEAAFKRLLGGASKKATKKKTTKKADASAKAQPADQQAATITSAELKQYVSKIRKLLTQRDYTVIDSGIELARSLDEAVAFEQLLKGCGIDKEGRLVRNKIFTGTGPAQPYLDCALLSLIAYAPEKTNLNESLKCSNIKSLSLDNNGAWTELPSCITSFPNLTSLNLSYKYIFAFDGPVNEQSDRCLQNVDVLANLTNLTSLNLSYCRSLQNVDGLANLTKLTSLDLSGCNSLPLSLANGQMTTRNEVAAYQEQTKKAMK